MKVLSILLFLTIYLFGANSDTNSTKKIAEDDKLVIVFTTTDGCSWCERMKRETINYKPSLKKIKEKFMFTKIDQMSGNMPSFLKPEAFPTTYILSTNGDKILASIDSYRSRKEFLGWIDKVYEKEAKKKVAKKSQAQDDDKLVLIFTHMDYCQWCKRMMRETIDYKPSRKEIEKMFMFAKIKRESGNMPSFLHPELFPTTYILSTNGDKILYEIDAYQSRENFLKEIKEVYELHKGKQKE